MPSWRLPATSAVRARAIWPGFTSNTSRPRSGGQHEIRLAVAQAAVIGCSGDPVDVRRAVVGRQGSEAGRGRRSAA
jgi:hypothetical protein